MSRPAKAGLDYFAHDTDASSDPKIQALMMKYGTMGYAFYFGILERIYSTEQGRLDISNPLIRYSIARSLYIPGQKFDKILETAIEIECFNKSEYQSAGILTSSGVRKRIEKVLALRTRDRERKLHKERDNTENKYKRKGKAKTGKLPESTRKTPIAPDFAISERVKEWAEREKYDNLDAHLAAFKRKCLANGYTYVDWDSAFMEAIRTDWAELRKGGSYGKRKGPGDTGGHTKEGDAKNSAGGGKYSGLETIVEV